MLGLNQELLQRLHWQTDAPTSRLDLNQNQLEYSRILTATPCHAQCSGSGIRCLLTPGSRIGFFRIPDLGSRILNPCVPGDPWVLGPPGSGSVSQRYGSRFGSGSFNHQAIIVRKGSVFAVFWLLYNFLSVKNDVNVPSKSGKQKSPIF